MKLRFLKEISLDFDKWLDDVFIHFCDVHLVLIFLLFVYFCEADITPMYTQDKLYYKAKYITLQFRKAYKGHTSRTLL